MGSNSLERKISNTKKVDSLTLHTKRAIEEYENSDKERITIVAIGLTLCYRLEKEIHVHRMSAVQEFSDYVAKHSNLDKNELSRIILKRLYGQ